jgi:hypothetical protein
MGILGAIALGFGAALTEGSEIKGYTGQHNGAALLFLAILLLMAACLVDVAVVPTMKQLSRPLKDKVAKVREKQAARRNLDEGHTEAPNTETGGEYQ